jgi:hypothetical protein
MRNLSFLLTPLSYLTTDEESKNVATLWSVLSCP